MKQTTINKSVVNKNICHVIHNEGLSFNWVKRPFFKKAMEYIENFGKGYVSPSYHRARVTYLHKEIEGIDKVDLQKYTKKWRKKWSMT